MQTLVPSPQQVEAELQTHRRFRDALLQELPELDDETLADTLEGLTNLNEMIAAVIRSALIDAALATGLKQRLEDMRARRARLEDRAQKKRALALRFMREGRIKRVTDPEFTASLKAAAPSLAVEHEADIPDAFWVAQAPKLDRQAILAALRSGATVPGACLEIGQQQLSVRTR